MPLQPLPDVSPREQNIKNATNITVRSLELFGRFRPEGLAFSFNGGKDSTAVLHLLLTGVKAWMKAGGKQWVAEDGLAGMHVFFFKGENDFQEINSFVKMCDECHHLSLKVYTCGFKTGIMQMLSERPIKGIFLGTRHGDPNCGDQEFFCPSSTGWPPFMRINPILNWTYGDVWAFLHDVRATYCRLYDHGYTSLGSVNDTKPNSALLRPNGTYAPAHELNDGRLERSGREDGLGQRQHSTKPEMAEAASIAIIGDEILCGRVVDTNSPFLVTELHRLGWKVQKVVVLPDSVHVISRELQAMMATSQIVVTCGGLGPTVDDITVEAVGVAVGAHVAPDSVLSASICKHFGDKMQESHLKMARIPEGVSELLPHTLPSGQLSPFPLLKVANIFVLPGLPSLVRLKWDALRAYLQTTFEASHKAWHNRVVRLQIADEAHIADLFKTLVDEFPDVSAGSYPDPSGASGGTVSISLEAKDESQVIAAVHRLKELLDKHLDSDVSQACITQIDVDVETMKLAEKKSTIGSCGKI